MAQDKTIEEYSAKIKDIKSEMSKVIVGQQKLVDSLIIALLSGGHIILEGVPGLAKTLSIQTLSSTLDMDFSRISFTPDLLPGDLIGGQIYNQSESRFYTKKGPIFTNFLLADEINRAPSKVQSALLEAMQEKKVTISDETFDLGQPFLVLATQNPIEQEGTYNLPEAQLDRFLLKVIIDYPNESEEIEIMKNSFNQGIVKISKILTKKDVVTLQTIIESQVFVDDKIYAYVKDIIFSTRYPDRYPLAAVKEYISFGASPRASIGLIKTAKVLAFMDGRDYVTPDDIKTMVPDVLRHRIGLSFEALGENISTDSIIQSLLDSIVVP